MYLLTVLMGLAAFSSAAPQKKTRVVVKRDGADTEVTLGDKFVDWGCDGSIKDPLGAGFDERCKEGAVSCDSSQIYEYEIKYAKNGVPPTQENLELKFSGKVPNKDIRDQVRDGLLATVNDDSWYADSRRWNTIGGGGQVSSQLPVHRVGWYLTSW
jgi:hypothetical protein